LAIVISLSVSLHESAFKRLLLPKQLELVVTTAQTGNEFCYCQECVHQDKHLCKKWNDNIRSKCFEHGIFSVLARNVASLNVIIDGGRLVIKECEICNQKSANNV
jgi:hypothetical protein